MRLDLRQDLRLSQKLVVTVQLQQAIKLLQLNHMEMVEAVQAEMLDNPTLEEIPGTEARAISDQERKLQDGARSQQEDLSEQRNGAQEEGVDWAKVLDEYSSSSSYKATSGGSRYDDLPPIEASLTRPESLTDHLMAQLGESLCTDAERFAAAAIIHNLDHRGWLDVTLEMLADELGVDMDAMEGAHEIVMYLEPVGCGSLGLVECLVFQARQRWPEDPAFEVILSEHLGGLESRNYAGIARAMGLHMEDVVEYHRMIQELEPWPGRPFGDAPSPYITPDITVVKIGGEWQILQNDDGMPRLRVSPYYRKILAAAGSNKEALVYIKEKLESADFLIKSIYKRQRTIHKVTECILRRQEAFFDKGTEHLTPMILKDVAEEIGVHESTVSRVTTNKYLQCPHGIFELKYFFNAAIQRLHGADLAAESVKEKIRKLIAEENPKKPLSDQGIVKALQARNVKIARRTVAKYREAMGILSSTQRKQLF
ncbi:MAG: RNA polymerase factor sigma-54, partial [Myxococcota bacterium]|nr:RNA polymerase factor sigma-54 [Myxococcota bacterium]